VKGYEACTENSKTGGPKLVAVYGTGGHLPRDDLQTSNALMTSGPTSMITYLYNFSAVNTVLRLSISVYLRYLV
jgi:hypothetical protein